MRALQARPARLVETYAGRDLVEMLAARRQRPRDRGRGLVADPDHRIMPWRLHREQPRLRRRIALEPVIAIEMVGGEVEQNRDIAIEVERQIELVARQFKDIDTPLRQRIFTQAGQPNYAAQPRGHTGGLDEMVDQRGGGRLAD